MARKKKENKKSLTRFFLRGLGALLPLVLTIFIFVTLLSFARTYVTRPINNTIYWTLEANGLGWKALGRMGIDPYAPEYVDVDVLPVQPVNLKKAGEDNGYDSPFFLEKLAEHRVEHESFFRDYKDLCIDPEAVRDDVSARVHPLIGLLISVLLVLWLGWVLTGFLGRRLLQKFDQALLAIPGVRAVYPYAKQLVEFFISDTELEFDTVVAVPYPNEYTYSLGFVTSQSLRSLRSETGLDLVSLFIPSSPMPMTGYTIHVPKHKLMVMPLTIDEALRITVSGGVLVPPDEFVGVGFGEAALDALKTTPNPQPDPE